MNAPDSISSYLRAYGTELGARVLAQFPALHQPSDPVWPALKLLVRSRGGASSALSGRRTTSGFSEWPPWNSSEDTSPRHSAPPRYVSEKLVRIAIDSALTGTFDGRSLRLPPPSSSPGAEPSVSNSFIRATLPERTPLRAAILSFESETGPDENRLSQVVRSESSNIRSSRSDRSATGMIDVDYAMRP